MGALKELTDELNKQKARVEKGFKKALQAEIAEFFEAFPAVDAIRWHQYTPGFNDGDPCRFTISEVQVRMKDRDEDGEEEGDEDEEDDDEFTESVSEEKYPGLSDALGDLESLIQDNEDVVEEVLGNGVQVTATAKKIETEDSDYGY